MCGSATDQSVLIAAASLAALTAAFQPVTPTAIRMPMIAITIINSISEKPRWFFFCLLRGSIVHSSHVTRTENNQVPLIYCAGCQSTTGLREEHRCHSLPLRLFPRCHGLAPWNFTLTATRKAPLEFWFGRCHGLVPWSFTFAATRKATARILVWKMPRACPVEVHVRRYQKGNR